MINTQLEEFVSLALDAYLNVDGDRNNYDHISNFELQLRRLLMQKYCNNTLLTKPNHTYTINPGEGAMGTWVIKDCPPTILNTSKKILNG